MTFTKEQYHEAANVNMIAAVLLTGSGTCLIERYAEGKYLIQNGSTESMDRLTHSVLLSAEPHLSSERTIYSVAELLYSYILKLGREMMLTKIVMQVTILSDGSLQTFLINADTYEVVFKVRITPEGQVGVGYNLTYDERVVTYIDRLVNSYGSNMINIEAIYKGVFFAINGYNTSFESTINDKAVRKIIEVFSLLAVRFPKVDINLLRLEDGTFCFVKLATSMPIFSLAITEAGDITNVHAHDADGAALPSRFFNSLDADLDPTSAEYSHIAELDLAYPRYVDSNKLN